MSTLTKVLIVLLSVFSIFLCGIVVTYVANSGDKAKLAKENESKWLAARRTEENAKNELQTETDNFQREKEQLGAQITSLKAQAAELAAQLEGAKTENAGLVQRVAAMTATVETANKMAQEQTALFKAAQVEIGGLRADQSNRGKELDETTLELADRMSISAQLEEKVRRLTEENQNLQTSLDRYLQQYGRMATRPATTVMPRSTAVQPVPATTPLPAPTPQTRPIGLSGRVTGVDLKNRMAAISIGSAAGVRQDMKFYVIRGDQFVANILILNVDPDKAVGILDLVKMDPQVGDTVTTNL